ncbi:hypothetical protein [Psychromicrobium lacuslunae]|uniref:Integral membrane protein n=1 Tax=Psychromicrobium lacuslunae TaxID=1618207 RepID=A0A0D4BZ61_9MICC|nr:hypothetical protein [Psychromicrobium lacuslunae]AJT41584.1 hypothetical protein UM93_08780 [Psychromicrobium lacuslunae]
MRSFFSAAAALVALVLAGVSVPVVWADRTVIDQDGFLAMATPLGNDAKFQQALATATAKTMSSKLDAVPAFSAMAQPLIENVTKSITTDPGYPAAWSETLRRSHELTLVDPAANANDQGALNLDVAPLMQLIFNKLGAGFGQQLKAPSQVLISLGTPSQREALVKLREFVSMGIWLALGALVAAILALLIARRRSTTLALIGLGGLVVVAGWKLSLSLLSQNVLNATAADPVAELFKQEYVAAAGGSFDFWILCGLIVAASLLLIGLIGRLAARRR